MATLTIPLLKEMSPHFCDLKQQQHYQHQSLVSCTNGPSHGALPLPLVLSTEGAAEVTSALYTTPHPPPTRPTATANAAVNRHARCDSLVCHASSTPSPTSNISCTSDDGVFWSLMFDEETSDVAAHEPTLFDSSLARSFSSSPLPLEQLSSCRSSVWPGGQAPLYELLDPLKWDCSTVALWLSRKVFASGSITQTRQADLEFYQWNFVAMKNERLSGAELSDMSFASYFSRWGYSAPAVFESFLNQLQTFGHAQALGCNLLDVWHQLQVAHPVASTCNLAAKGIHHRSHRPPTFQSSLHPVLEQIGDDDDDGEGLATEAGSQLATDFSQQDELETHSTSDCDIQFSTGMSSPDSMLLDTCPASLPSPASPVMSDASSVDTLCGQFSPRSSPMSGSAAAMMLWSPDNMSSCSHAAQPPLTPTSQPREASSVSDSDYESLESSASPTTDQACSPPGELVLSPASECPLSVADSSMNSPKLSPEYYPVKKQRHRKPRQRTPLPPSLTFPEASGVCSTNAAWSYIEAWFYFCSSGTPSP
eukprot:scpid12607/ scgid4256/ 